MRHAVAIGLAGVVCAFGATAVAATAKGVVPAASHVAGVEVVEHDTHAPAAFAGEVLADALKEAVVFPADGRSITLRIEIDSVHFKNAMRSMLIGDTNIAQGHVTVVDTATGQVLGTFKLVVNGDRPSTGMRVLSAIDPTGLVALSQAMSDTNAGKEENVMASNFAQEALRQTYGDAASKAAHARPASAAAPVSGQPAALRSAEGPEQLAAASHSTEQTALSGAGVIGAPSLVPLSAAAARAP